MEKLVNFLKEVKADKKLQKAAGIGVISSVLVIVLILLFVNIFKSPAYRVVDKFMDGYVTFDADKIIDTFHEDFIDALEDSEDDDYIEELEEQLESMEDGDEEYMVSYDILSYYDYTEDRFDDYVEYLDEYYGIDEDDVKAIRSYLVSFVYEEDGDEGTESSEITVAKINGKWYVVSLYF